MIRSANTRAWPLAVLALVALVVASCTETPAADTSDTTAGPTTTEARLETTTNPDTTEPPGASEVVAEAVDDLVEVGTYAFEATIQLSVQGEQTEVELEGWVDGSDRELVMKIGEQSVTTRVVDGVATVERDGDTVEVPLTEAGSAPSILLLQSIENAEFGPDGTITGELAASDLTSSDYEVTGSATITVTVTPDGSLSGYSMVAEDGSWSVDVRFTDVGEIPRR